MRFDDVRGAHAKRALEVAASGDHTISFFGEGPIAAFEQLAACIGVEVVSDAADITVEVPTIPEWMKSRPSEPHDHVMQRISDCGHHDLPLTVGLSSAGVRHYSLTQIQICQAMNVALTIANMARARSIDPEHVAEALQYRE